MGSGGPQGAGQRAGRSDSSRKHLRGSAENEGGNGGAYGGGWGRNGWRCGQMAAAVVVMAQRQVVERARGGAKRQPVQPALIAQECLSSPTVHAHALFSSTAHAPVRKAHV